MAQLAVHTATLPTAESVLINTSKIRVDTLEDVGGSTQFYIGSTLYQVSAELATLQAQVSNYDSKVVVPLQVVTIDGGVIGAQVSIGVDNIEAGYVREATSLLIIRNQGFLQSWIVSDTLEEIAGLANLVDVADDTITFENVVVRGNITVLGDASVTGELAVTEDVAVTGNIVVTGDIAVTDIVAAGDVVVEGELGADGECSFANEVTIDKGLYVGEDAIILGGLTTNVVDAPDGEGLEIGETADDIIMGPVGTKSDTDKIALYILPGEETLTAGSAQELSLVGITYLETTGENSDGTLIDGTVAGQVKKIWMTSTSGGTWQVTFSSVYYITFTNQGEWITLVWNGTIWEITDKGLCDGAPVVGVA